MKYNVISFIVNKSNQYVAKVEATYDNIGGAKVKYHQLLASLHNASDVLFASVKLVNEYGNEVSGYFEMVDHTPIEPEASETTETE